MTINHIPALTDEEFRWTLQRLFPFPEDMGPFLSDRFKVFVRTMRAEDVSVNPMSGPSSKIFYMDII